MTSYRLYRLDGAGRITGAAELIEGADDDEAVAAARALGHSGVCELWQGRRFVTRVSSAQSQ